mmetsp:Transcript_3365/g.4898  ORF Transcript_3365/g.4898 Transcript_3365/m.4898 type:complete len:238 (+) Transcript_3365:154-867(+)
MKLLTISMCLSGATAFTLPVTKTSSTFLVKSSTEAVPYFMEEALPSQANLPFVAKPAEEAKPVAPKAPTNSKAYTLQKKWGKPYTVVKTYGGKKAKKNPAHKEGVFSPIVFASKKIVGEDEINKLRAKIISLHSGVIGDFVETANTPVGSTISKQLFVVMDVNNDGTLDKDELKAGFEKLGFTWLQDKQVEGIINRADKNDDGVIDYDEFEAELTKTLRTNLIKLAKKNGGDMGFLV